MHLAIAVMGALAFVAIFFCLPETSHPGARGVEKMEAGSSKIVFVNPLRSLLLLKSPLLLLFVSPDILTCWVFKFIQLRSVRRLFLRSLGKLWFVFSAD
jgi:hypothetical protein